MAGDLITQPAPIGRPRATGARMPVAEVVDAEYVDTTTLHLRDYLRVLYKYRWLAATCFGVTLALALLATLLTTRTYVATTRLQIAKQSPIQLQLQENVLKVDGSERGADGTSTFLSTQVAILHSRDLAERVIREQRLEEKDAFNDPGARAGVAAIGGSLLNLLRPRGWSAVDDVRPEGGLSASEPSPRAINRYLSWLTVSDVRGTDLVDVTFTTPSAELSAFLAAAHTQAYIAANDEARLATNVTAKAFLGEQLREAREKLERSATALRDYASAHPSVAVDNEHDVATERIRGLAELLTKVEGDRVGMEARYDFLKKPGTDTLAYFLSKQGVEKLRLQILDLDAQEATLADRLGKNHPDMVALRQQRTALQQQLEAEVRTETDAVRAKHEALQLRETRLQDKLQQQEEAAIEAQAVAARYELLKKDLEAARELRDSLLKQQMETDVNSELAASNIRVVDRAEVPLGPAKPNVPLNLMLGGFVGVLFAVGATLVVEYFDSSVKSSEDVENLLNVPALAVIPSLAADKRSQRGRAGAAAPGNRSQDLVVHHEPRSLSAEAFRALRTAVLFSTPDQPPRVILMTSAGQGEGKTMTSLNLATTLAVAGSQVLLIDADLRRPSVHRAFAVSNDDGLSKYLARQSPLESVTHGTEVPNLAIVPAGPIPPNPAELVGSARMRDLLAQLRDKYDFVIVDSPPTLPVTDAVLLAREADGVVLVVKGHDTPRELVRRARDQLQNAGGRILGALINNVTSSWGAGDYYYRRYYGAYYGQPEAQAS
jgi:succinoglycan biosynthesis transport protein ExoP